MNIDRSSFQRHSGAFASTGPASPGQTSSARSFSGRRARRLGVILAALAASTGLAPSTADAKPKDLADVTDPSISSAGDSVIFTATTSDHRSIFHLDLSSGEVTDLVQLPDARRDGDTIAAVLSDDGCTVVAVSQIAFDIFRDDDRGERWDVYRLVLPECGGQQNDWQLISTGANGLARDDIAPDQRPALSADGTLVAFTSPTDSERNTVMLVDTAEPIGSPERQSVVPGPPTTEPSRPFHYRGSDQPSISADGQTIAFRADYDPRSGTWNEGTEQGGFASTSVFVWDTSAPDAIVSPPADGLLELEQPALASDGATLGFVAQLRSTSSRRDGSCRSTCPTQVMRWSINPAEEPELVSAQRWTTPSDESATGPDEVPGNGSSWAPTLNADGSLIAFVTKATNLTISHPGGAGSADDGALMIAGDDLLAPALRPNEDGKRSTSSVAPGSGAQHRPDLSGTGSTVVFDAAAPFAVPKPNRVRDVKSSGRQLGIATIPPRLTLAELNFGSVKPGQESAELYTSVRNLGPSSFQASEVSTDSDRFVVTGGTCQARVIVSPGGTCTVRVTFTPGDTGTDDAELAIVDNLGTTVRGTLRGKAGNPRLRIDPAGADLGHGPVGANVGTSLLTVTNIAYDPTEISGVTVGGKDPANFEVVEDNCTGNSLGPAQSCSVSVRYRPVEAGYQTATVIAEATSGDMAAAVVGGGADRRATVTASTAEVAPGDAVELRGEDLEPGTKVWAAIVGERQLSGPFVVDADGSVVAEIRVPKRLRAEQIQVALQDESSAVFAHPLRLVRSEQTTPTLLPGFGYGGL